MTVEVLVFAAFPIVGSLPILRRPLAGGLIALIVDLPADATSPAMKASYGTMPAALRGRRRA